MPNFYLTFGQVHHHELFDKELDRDTVAMIPAEDYQAGRRKAFRYFEDKYCWFYDEEEFNTNREKLLSYFPKGIVELP
jgi:hypothetical protein